MSDRSHQVILTAAGLEKLRVELDELTSVRRPAVTRRISDARSLGDIRENFDFHDAKREQAFIEGRVRALQEMIGRARVVSEEEADGDRVSIGSAVELVNLETNGTSSYTILGAVEASPAQGKISNVSPVGKALLGKSEGDEVEITTPRGVQRYRITAVRRSE